MARLFLAVPVRLYAYEPIQKEFTPLLQGKWRGEAHLHVTIAFLAHRFEPKEVMERLSLFDFSFEPSELGGFDYFPNSRVLVALTQNPTLQNLYDRLASLLGLEPLHLHPHVTLMRVKKILNPTRFTGLLNTPSPLPLGKLESAVALYQSTLHPEGARYEVLREWPL